MILRRIFCAWVLISFLGTSLTLPSAHAQSATVDSTGLSFLLPKPGNRVDLSPAFEPILIKGLRVHPENPFIFDFIVDPGNEKLNADDLKKRSQRMVNYFLASLAVPEKDLWVNLSPVEKDRIIPDALNKTELGRDLLAEDYMLKQVTASLIYPESSFGRAFWSKVYDEAYRKLGVTQIPVNVFNKVWILPEKASVYERGNTVYIVKAHLKVMLEEDYLAQIRLGNRTYQEASSVPVKDLSKQVLREIVIPAIEKEVNEGKNFAQLRQVFYSLILAQWYQDAFKKSVLNKDYSGRNKVTGIDFSDPKNKEHIYQQYVSAYKKGVFNYIKEETDKVTQQVLPKKYFSGGFVGQKVKRETASGADIDRAMASGGKDFAIIVNLNPSEAEAPSSWNGLSRPLGLLKELRAALNNGQFDRSGLYAFIDRYSAQVASQKLYPVQAAWPVLKAITLLSKSEEQDLIAALQERYSNPQRPELVDKILLMNNIFDRETWLKERAPHLLGRRIYLAAAEIHYWAGGLGPVMKFHGKGMKDLGADIKYIEPWYQSDLKGNPLDYTNPNMGLKELNEDFDEFDVKIGDIGGKYVQTVHVKVATGIDENGIRVYMFRDVQPDGKSFYTKMLYNYEGRDNPVTKEQSMAFLNVASAELILRLETKRKQEMEDVKVTAWLPAVVHGNDGQFAPLQAVTMSRYGSKEVIKDIFWAFTTHTYGNRGRNDDKTWGINVFLKHMMGIKDYFINAFRQFDHIDHTSGGVRLANWAGAVSDKHRDDVTGKDPNANLTSVTNGAVPEEMAAMFRKEFKKLQQAGKISLTADFERLTPQEDALVKIECKKLFNQAKVQTANGGVVEVDLDKPLMGYDRRLVRVKAGRQRAFTDENIWRLVMLGYNVVLMGNHQGTNESEELAAGLRNLEKKIAAEKLKRPEEFSGKFQFVQSFTAQEKKVFLAAADIQIQDSDDHTGAAEFSEEDITANGGLQGGPKYREGVIVDQGIPVDFKNPGRGNTLVPQDDTARSWVETVYIPLMSLWKKDKDHIDFYKNAALSPRLNRIQRYLITSAAYLREYESVFARQEKQAQIDHDAQLKIVQALKADQVIIKGLLDEGRNGVAKPFGFTVWEQGSFEAKASGLIAFMDTKNDLENRFGYDALVNHYNAGDFQGYLRDIFDHTGTDAGQLLNDWLNNLGSEETGQTNLEKATRLGQFTDGLIKELEKERKTDKALVANPGGIKLDHIAIEHHGNLTTDLIGNKAFEDMLLKAQGLYGVIVGITPIASLSNFIQ